jgi:hypothetical protein
MEVECSSETLVSTYKSTWRYNPDNQHWHLHGRENLKCHTFYLFYSFQWEWELVQGWRKFPVEFQRAFTLFDSQLSAVCPQREHFRVARCSQNLFDMLLPRQSTGKVKPKYLTQLTNENDFEVIASVVRRICASNSDNCVNTWPVTQCMWTDRREEAFNCHWIQPLKTGGNWNLFSHRFNRPYVFFTTSHSSGG